MRAEQKLSRRGEKDKDVCVRAEQKLSRQMERERERERERVRGGVCARAGKVRPRAAVPAILGD